MVDCDEEPSPCAALNSVSKRFVGSDDCLYLNIFTKNINPTKPSAVMVYIYGGGHGRGATCVGLHCMVESSRGLFNRAIIMSGSPLASESVCEDKNYGIKLAKKLGYNGRDNESDVLAFLEKANVISMAEAQQTLTEVGAIFLQ
ncbi:hypothetical protein HA402_005739, partial [Bradysia odoriphaga]